MNSPGRDYSRDQQYASHRAEAGTHRWQRAWQIRCCRSGRCLQQCRCRCSANDHINRADHSTSQKGIDQLEAAAPAGHNINASVSSLLGHNTQIIQEGTPPQAEVPQTHPSRAPAHAPPATPADAPHPCQVQRSASPLCLYLRSNTQTAQLLERNDAMEGVCRSPYLSHRGSKQQHNEPPGSMLQQIVACRRVSARMARHSTCSEMCHQRAGGKCASPTNRGNRSASCCPRTERKPTCNAGHRRPVSPRRGAR